MFAQLGRAGSTTALTAGASWEWPWQWALGAHGRLSGYHDVSIGRWRAERSVGAAVVTQVGFTPVLRYWPRSGPAGWFVEAAVGVNAMTPLYRRGTRQFSTVFNFGDHVAVGRRGDGWELTLRYQHFSNDGIKRPNPGENFVQLRSAIVLD